MASRPMRRKFSAASTQLTDISLPAARGGHTPAAGRILGSSTQGSAAAAAWTSLSRRREKINRRLMELATLIPGLKQMNKATILEDAVKYARELQEKVKTLENDNHHAATTTIHSTVLVHKKKPCLSGLTSYSSDDDVGEPSHWATWLPEIEVRVSDKSVLVQIHCKNARGLLVRVLAEMEVLRLAITHTSSMPFQADTTIINITAKVEEGFNSTVEEMVKRINMALE